MEKGTIERFTLAAVADALDGSDVATARDRLSQVVGAVVEVSGTVRKRVKRAGECKLVIQPGDVPGFVVFADCQPDAEKVQARKIRKGSSVSVRGKFSTFGAAAVCLVDCRLDKVGLQKKGDGKPQKTSDLETSQNFTFRARKTRNNRERIKAKAEKKQRQNKEITRKRGAFVP